MRSSLRNRLMQVTSKLSSEKCVTKDAILVGGIGLVMHKTFELIGLSLSELHTDV